MESTMKLVRREFLHLAGAMAMDSAPSQSSEAAAGPSPTEILRSGLVGCNCAADKGDWAIRYLKWST